MREEFYIETFDSAVVVSADVVNEISQYLIAAVETEEDLDNLAILKFKEKTARKEAFKLAYKEVPLPSGGAPMDVLRELAERRNVLVEKYFEEIMKKL